MASSPCRERDDSAEVRLVISNWPLVEHVLAISCKCPSSFVRSTLRLAILQRLLQPLISNFSPYFGMCQCGSVLYVHGVRRKEVYVD